MNSLDYLTQIELRREINEGLNVVENSNSVNGFICYGNRGDIPSNKHDDQKVAALCLHLLQSVLVCINTLMIQDVLADSETLTLDDVDRRALTPLPYGHVNPYLEITAEKSPGSLSSSSGAVVYLSPNSSTN